jgi:ribosomal protein S28E/S33
MGMDGNVIQVEKEMNKCDGKERIVERGSGEGG